MITDFPTNPLTNMAGMQAFSFSPVQNVGTWPPVLSNKTSWALIFAAGKSFFKGYSTIDTLEFVESGADDDNGEIYNWQVNGFYPGDGDDTLDLMQSIKACKQLVVLTKDYSGVLRLVGYKAPLQFGYSYGSGKVAGSDARGYNFTFYGQGGSPAPVYNPAAFIPAP